ncbi:MAG: hypothetical protein LBQ31_05930 [Bacteroidales bacterium]|jgi:hypothetical protein|nr:hypothetical protein [Bacteroidales bacterium]
MLFTLLQFWFPYDNRSINPDGLSEGEFIIYTCILAFVLWGAWKLFGKRFDKGTK